MAETTMPVTENSAVTTCTAAHCRYCHAAADYLGVPQGHPQGCHAAKRADQWGELAAFDYLRTLAQK